MARRKDEEKRILTQGENFLAFRCQSERIGGRGEGRERGGEEGGEREEWGRRGEGEGEEGCGAPTNTRAPSGKGARARQEETVHRARQAGPRLEGSDGRLCVDQR